MTPNTDGFLRVAQLMEQAGWEVDTFTSFGAESVDKETQEWRVTWKRKRA